MKLDGGDNCVNGVAYCFCFTTDVNSEGLTLDFASTKGLGEMEWVRNRNSQSHSEDIQYDDQSFDSDSDTKDEEGAIFSNYPVGESSVSNRLTSQCHERKNPDEIIPAHFDEAASEGTLCPLCPDSKRKGGFYLKIQCQGGCRFSCHFDCYLASMKDQGLTRKKDYKDGVCPTDGCGYPIHTVHKIGLDQENELYVMGASTTLKKPEPAVRKEKKKEATITHQKKGVNCRAGMKDTHTNVNEYFGTPPLQDEVSEDAEGPCTARHRAAPLKISEPVVHLEKKANKLEEKYAVSCSTATSKRTVKKTKKNDTLNITDVLMISKRDDPHKMKSIAGSGKKKRGIVPTEAGRSADDDVLWEQQEPVLSSKLFVPPIDSSSKTVLDQIADKIEPYLPDLLLNTRKWSPHDYFPSDDLRDAILAVGVNIFSHEERSEICNLFLGGFLQIEEFVKKLRYFTCVKKGFFTEVIKNECGKLLEETRVEEIDSSTPSTIPTAPLTQECLICLQSAHLDESVGLMHCPDCKEPYHSEINIETMESGCSHGFALCLCASAAITPMDEDSLPDYNVNWETSEEERHDETEIVPSDTQCGPLLPDAAAHFPIGCSLCVYSIQPMSMSYMQISCYGSCSYYLHRNCYFDAMQKQGFNRKKDFKDANCPTDGCGNKVSAVHEIDLQMDVKLYYKDSKSKSTKSEISVIHKDKRRDSCLSGKKAHSNKRKVHLPNDISKTEPPSRSVSMHGCSDTCVDSAVPSILRTAPLPLIASGNVIPLAKKINEVEEKYHVSSSNDFQKNPRKQRKVQSVNITDVLVPRKSDQKFNSHHCVHKESRFQGLSENFRQVPSSWEDLVDDAQWESDVIHLNLDNSIIIKLESFLHDLVFNTVSFMKSEFFPSNELRDAILCVGCDILSIDEKSAIQTIFCGDFYGLEKFVTKLQYFDCIQSNFETKIKKNNRGRIIESEGIPSFSMRFAQMPVDPPGLIHPNVRAQDTFLQRTMETSLLSSIDESGKREQLEERCKLQASIAEEQHVSKMIQLKLQKLNLLVDVRRNARTVASEQPNLSITSTIGSFSKNFSPHCPSGDNSGFGEDISPGSADYSFYGAKDSSSRTSWNSSFDNCSSTSNMVAPDLHQNALNTISKLEFELRKADMDRKKTERDNQKLRQVVETMKDDLQNLKNSCKERHIDLFTLSAEAEKIGNVAETVANSDNVRLRIVLLECEKRLTYIVSSLAHSDAILKSVTDLKLCPDAMISELTANVEKWREFETHHLDSLALLKEGHIVILPDDDDIPLIPQSIYEFFIQSFKETISPYIKLASEFAVHFKTLLSSRVCLTKAEFPTEDAVQSFIIQYLRRKRDGKVDVGVIVDEYISQNGFVTQAPIHGLSSSKNDHCGIWKNIQECVTKREVDLSENECMICYDSLLDATMGILNCPACNEPFHFKCVTTWLCQSPACPKCRLHWPDPEDFPSL